MKDKKYKPGVEEAMSTTTDVWCLQQEQDVDDVHLDYYDNKLIVIKTTINKLWEGERDVFVRENDADDDDDFVCVAWLIRRRCFLLLKPTQGDDWEEFSLFLPLTSLKNTRSAWCTLQD